MTNGDFWPAIAELRQGHTRHERELGALSAGQSELKEDVDRLADEQRKTRHDLRNQMAAVEGRLTTQIRVGLQEIRDEQTKENEDSISQRRFRLMLGAPVFCVILAFVLGRVL